MDTPAIQLDDVRRFALAQSPDLPDIVLAFLAQDDPVVDAPAPGTIPAQTLTHQLARAARYRSAVKRVTETREAWSRFLAQPELPPRFQLADVLVQLYESNTEPARAAVVEIALSAPLRFGLWAGLKRIYKLSEERMDAEVFGVLTARFDAPRGRSRGGNVSVGTMIYLRRRAWRFLRHLGASVPEIYPQFVVQVLRNYQHGHDFSGTWVANHVWGHGSKRYDARHFSGNVATNMMKHRAFPDAWKRSADPLMLLLESAQADEPARFAIEGLQKDFPDKLRNVTPAWLARLALRPLGSVHDFLVSTLQSSPEFHQGKLKGLGLHDTVLALLTSPSKTARAYAIEYARAHAQDLSPEKLLELLGADAAETKAFAATVIKSRKPRDLGFAYLGRLLPHEAVSEWAKKALLESFERKELPESFYFDMLFGEDEQIEWASGYLAKQFRPGEIDAAFWKRMLDDPRAKSGEHYEALEVAVESLGKFPADVIGADWLLAGLTRDELQYHVGKILEKAENLPGLDVEKLKGLVFNARHRDVALKLLGNNKLVKPRDMGLPWLLALARRADPTLHQWAHRYLLQHMRPEDFSEAGDKSAGVARLFALALGEKEPEPVRTFAQTYLRCHHTGIGPEQSESKSLGIRPKMPRDAYTADRLWPALFDPRADVRGFAVAITRAELRRWGYQTRVYELGESEAKEVRNIAYDALLKAGEADADPALTLRPEELDPAGVFSMSESRRRPTREVAVELIRRHYDRLGGPEKLGWLMQSADREVRLFAVRLLWEKHRPRSLPPGWKPTRRAGEAPGPEAPFANVEALRGFLRTVLYGLPPGRSAESSKESAVRRIPSSRAKRNVIEVVRDLGMEDQAFARLVAPVLGEFTGSVARTEWQACLSALAHLRRAHQGVEFGGV